MNARGALEHEPAYLSAGDAFVDAWLGVPFAWDGRGRHGIDCWGLVATWFRDVRGRELPDWRRADRSRAWVRETIAQEAASHWLALAQPCDGCICMVKARGTQPHHVGIYWRGQILHAAEKRGVVLERYGEFMSRHPAAQFGEYAP